MKKLSRTENSIRNISVSLFGYFFNTLLTFVCRVIFVRCLSQDYLGLNGLFSNILSILSLSELGISTAIGYALYKPIVDDDQNKIASVMKFFGQAYRLIGLFIVITGLALIPFLDVLITETPDIAINIPLLYIVFLFNTVIGYFVGYEGILLSASQRNYAVLSINYALLFVQSIIQIAVLLITHNYLLYLFVHSATLIVSNVLVARKTKRVYPCLVQKNISPLSKEETTTLRKNVYALMVTKVSGTLVNNTDNIAITYFDGLVTTGIASNYQLFISILTSILAQIFSGLSASIGNLNAQADDRVKHSFFNVVNLSNFWFFGWGTIGIIFVSSDLVRLCFGENYILGFEIPMILAINFYMVGMQNAVWTYKSTLGLFRQGRYLLLVTAALNLIGDIILGRAYGMFGIFMATAIARLVTNTWYDPYVVFKYGLHANPLKYLIQYLHYLLILVGTALVCWFFCAMINTGIFATVVLKVLICTIVPNAIFLIAFHRTEEFRYLCGKLSPYMRKLISLVRKR